MNAETFLKLGNLYTKTACKTSKYVAERRFTSFFGVTPYVCSIIWEKLLPTLPIGGEPKHFLWALTFLRQYAVEHYRHSIFNADEKTIRKWTWIFVKLLSDLEMVFSYTYKNL